MTLYSPTRRWAAIHARRRALDALARITAQIRTERERRNG